MPIVELSFDIFIIILLMIASVFFSLAETSILSLNKIRLKSYIEKKRENAIIIKELLNNPENFLAAILIGNNIVNITISVLITVVVIQIFGPNAVTLATILATFLILAFGEITPKAFAARNPDIAYKLAPIMKFLIWILNPLIVFLPGLQICYCDCLECIHPSRSLFFSVKISSILLKCARKME